MTMNLLRAFILLCLGVMSVLVPGMQTPPRQVLAVVEASGIHQPDRVIELFEKHPYTMVSFSSLEVPRIVAERIVFIFVGHNGPHPMTFLSNFWAKEIIVLTSTCYGGEWLQYATRGSLFISQVNDTRSYYTPELPSTWKLVELWEEMPLELAFIQWNGLVRDYYTQPLFQGNYANCTPVMQDLLSGWTYL